MQSDAAILETLRASGRAGASIFAACCAERLRPLLRQLPPGAPPLVAGVALTELWRVLEGLQRADPRRLAELAQACWTQVEVEPVAGVSAAHLEALLSAAHDALETYLSGNPKHALAAAKTCTGVSGAEEAARQERDLADIAASRGDLAQLATRLRQRAETGS